MLPDCWVHVHVRCALVTTHHSPNIDFNVLLMTMPMSCLCVLWFSSRLMYGARLALCPSFGRFVFAKDDGTSC